MSPESRDTAVFRSVGEACSADNLSGTSSGRLTPIIYLMQLAGHGERNPPSVRLVIACWQGGYGDAEWKTRPLWGSTSVLTPPMSLHQADLVLIIPPEQAAFKARDCLKQSFAGPVLLWIESPGQGWPGGRL